MTCEIRVDLISGNQLLLQQESNLDKVFPGMLIQGLHPCESFLSSEQANKAALYCFLVWFIVLNIFESKHSISLKVFFPPVLHENIQ